MAKGIHQSSRKPATRGFQDRELVSETLEMLQTCYQQLVKLQNGQSSCGAVKEVPVP